MDNNQRGAINVLAVPLAAVVLLLLVAATFGFWAFAGRQDYKNNSDQKAAAAAALAKQQTQASDAVVYAEQAKSPLKTWVGPSQYGNLKIQYPKTWSGYVVTSSSQVVEDAYFYPDVVPNINDNTNSYALRLQIINQGYDQAVAGFGSQVKQGKLTATPFTLPKVASVVGTRLDGQITNSKTGSIIVVPVRNVTLEIWTESTDYLSDFNNNVLPYVTFSP